MYLRRLISNWINNHNTPLNTYKIYELNIKKILFSVFLYFKVVKKIIKE